MRRLSAGAEPRRGSQLQEDRPGSQLQGAKRGSLLQGGKRGSLLQGTKRGSLLEAGSLDAAATVADYVQTDSDRKQAQRASILAAQIALSGLQAKRRSVAATQIQVQRPASGDGSDVWNATVTPRGCTFPHIRRVQRDVARDARHISNRVENLAPPMLDVCDIYVQRAPGKTVAILESVSITQTLGWQIKQMIKSSTGMPIGGVNLMFGGSILKDEEALGQIFGGYAVGSTAGARLKITLWAVS